MKLLRQLLQEGHINDDGRYVSDDDDDIDQNFNAQQAEIKKLLTKHCAKFCKAVGGVESALTKYPLYRGLATSAKSLASKRVAEDTFILPVRKDREPRDTNAFISKIMDEMFFEKFKWKPRREGMFCTSFHDEAAMFGTLYQVFPIGNYQFLWSPKIKDLTVWWEDNFNESSTEEHYAAFREEFSLILKTYKSTSLKDAIKSEHEVMFNCDSYIAVRRTSVNGESYD